MRYFIVILALCFPSTYPTVQADQPPVAVRYALDNPDFFKRYEYPLTLLDMALAASSPGYGPYRLERTRLVGSQQRIRRIVAQGDLLDITFGMSRPEIEAEMLVVPFPLMRGLLGYRLMITHPDRLAALENVKSVSELSQYVAVQGAEWTDTQVLRANHLPVITSTDYPSMFRMVQGKRVDYFPRGVAEAWTELTEPIAEGLVLNQRVVLQYPGPYYFFVSRHNPELAQRIYDGLMRLERSGELEKFVRSYPDMAKAIDFLESGDYQLLKLDVPFELPSLKKVPQSVWLSLD